MFRPATRAATQATEPIACDAYKPPTEPADSGLCARCGMFDYRHGAKERADRLEQQRNDVAQALREVLAGFREIPVPWGGDAVGYEAPHPIHPSNANRWRKVLDGLPVNCQKPGGCADCPHETEA